MHILHFDLLTEIGEMPWFNGERGIVFFLASNHVSNLKKKKKLSLLCNKIFNMKQNSGMTKLSIHQNVEIFLIFYFVNNQNLGIGNVK